MNLLRALKNAVIWPLFFIFSLSSNTLSALDINGKPLSDVSDFNLLFNVAMASVEKQYNTEAIKILRHMLSINPQLHRVRLELAHILFNINEYDAAKIDFEYVLAADIPAEVRSNIQAFLSRIRINVTPSFWWTVEMVEDTNPMSSTNNDYIRVGSYRFKISEDSKPNTETGYAFYGGARFPLTKNGKWSLNTQIEHKEFDDSRLDYSYIHTYLMRGFEISSGHALQLSAGKHFSGYGGRSLFKGNVFNLEHQYQIKNNLMLRSNASFMHLNYYDIDNRDAKQRSINTKIHFNLNTAHQLQFGLGYLKSNARNNMFTYTRPESSITLNRYWKAGFITNIEVSKSWLDYDNMDLFFGKNRNDSEEQYELTIMNQKFSLFGVAPKLHFGRIKHSSNIDYYTFKRSYSKLSFSRKF